MRRSDQDSLASLLVGLPVGIFHFDSDMVVLWLTDAAAAMVGLEACDQLIGRCWYDLLPVVADRRPIYERVLAGEELDFPNARIDLPHGTRYFDVRYRPTSGGGMVVMSVDVTDRYIASHRASQANRLEALGRLAGGVAHDLNNHLTAILGSLDLALMERPDDVDIGAAIEGGERAADMVAQLLTFSRRRRLDPACREIADVIAHVADRMLSHLLGEDVKLDLDLDPATGSAVLDVGAFEQVLVNLAVNGREAMPGGGVLIIRSYPLAIDHRCPNGFEELSQGSYVVVEVADNGEGMDAETMAHCFDPFFTTKSQMTKNSGLGLATCYSIVQQMSGTILVESKPGHGATFRVVLERSAPHHAEDTDTSRLSELVRTEMGETVLVVDDDQFVRNLVVRTLGRCGYETIEASNAAEALLLADESRSSIDLLLTDVVLPRISGPILARRLRELHPSLRVLYMSGFADHPAVRDEVEGVEMAIIEKPFRAHQLAALVQQRLQAVGAP